MDYTTVAVFVYLGHQWAVERHADAEHVRPSARVRLACLGRDGYGYDTVATFHRKPNDRDLRAEARAYADDNCLFGQ